MEFGEVMSDVGSRKQLFVRVDPHELERYTPKSIPRRRRLPLEKIRRMEVLKRAMQRLPPRELQMLYTVEVRDVDQEEACRVYGVRQSNISYRLERAADRIKIFSQIAEMVSETRVRLALAKAGLNETMICVVLGVIKTTSQSATAEAYNLTQGSVRHIYARAVRKMKEVDPQGPVLALLLFVERNYNSLRSVRIQRRWLEKVDGFGGGNYPNAPSGVFEDDVEEKTPEQLPEHQSVSELEE